MPKLSKDFKPDWAGWDLLVAKINALSSYQTLLLTKDDIEIIKMVDNYVKSHTIMDSLVWLGEKNVHFKVNSIAGDELVIQPAQVAKYLEDPIDFEARRFSVSKQCFIAYQNEVGRFSREGHFIRHCVAKTKKGERCKVYQTFQCQSIIRYSQYFWRKDYYCHIHQELLRNGKTVEKYIEEEVLC